MTFVVTWQTATHIDFAKYDTEAAARGDRHPGGSWGGLLHLVKNDEDDFGPAEAKDLHRHGADCMPPAWGITEIDLDVP